MRLVARLVAMFGPCRWVIDNLLPRGDWPLIVLATAALLIVYLANRFFRLREKKLEIEAMNAAEKAAQYAAHVERIEQRLRVLEQIAVDPGAQTAAQIEALRDYKSIGRKDEIQ